MVGSALSKCSLHSLGAFLLHNQYTRLSYFVNCIDKIVGMLYLVGMPNYLSVKQATKYLVRITTRAGVSAAIKRGEFPGARKLDPTLEKSTWLIPVEDIQAHPAYNNRPITECESPDSPAEADESGDS